MYVVRSAVLCVVWFGVTIRCGDVIVRSGFEWAQAILFHREEREVSYLSTFFAGPLCKSGNMKKNFRKHVLPG